MILRLINLPGSLPDFRGAAASGRRVPALVVATAALVALAACGATTLGGTAAGAERITVVAAENFWASIASQIGGDRVSVTAIITNPNTDPHAYEPTPADGRAIATARYVILDGAGYDPWARKLVDASPSPARLVLDVAGLAGRRDGDNPHMWYDPTIVEHVIHRIVRDLSSLDAGDATSFAQQGSTYETAGLARYDALRTAIRTRYRGVPVGATESIFVDLANDLGLDLITPNAYMKAISEGNDPAAADKATVDSQIAGRLISVLVVNSQNSTPDIQALADRARALGIPVVHITETLDPATATFQAWQSSQLRALQAALGQATGA